MLVLVYLLLGTVPIVTPVRDVGGNFAGIGTRQAGQGDLKLEIGVVTYDTRSTGDRRALVTLRVENTSKTECRVPLFAYYGKGKAGEVRRDIFVDQSVLDGYPGFAVARVKYFFRTTSNAIAKEGELTVTGSPNLVLEGNAHSWLTMSVDLPESPGSYQLNVTLDNTELEEAVYSRNVINPPRPVFVTLGASARVRIPPHSN